MEKTKSNGILFESNTHVMIETEDEGRLVLRKDFLELNYDGESYYVHSNQAAHMIRKETYYTLCEKLFGNAVESRLKLLESSGQAKKIYADKVPVFDATNVMLGTVSYYSNDSEKINYKPFNVELWKKELYKMYTNGYIERLKHK